MSNHQTSPAAGGAGQLQNEPANSLHPAEDCNIPQHKDGAEIQPAATTPQAYPALREGNHGFTLEEIKRQWILYNHNLSPRKDVISIVSEPKRGIWKSICACVKGLNTVKAWKKNQVCYAHLFFTKNGVRSIGVRHTCGEEQQGRRRNYNTKELHLASQELASTLPQGRRKMPRLQVARDYVEVAQQEGFFVGELQAYKVVSRLSQRPIHEQIGEYFLLQSAFSALQHADPKGTYLMETIDCQWKDNTRQFQRYYIAPSSSKHAWMHSQMHFLIIDDSPTCTSGSSIHTTLLLATTLDSNNQTLVLAFGICGVADEANWMWFLEHLSEDYREVNMVLSRSEHLLECKVISSFLDNIGAGFSQCLDVIIKGMERTLDSELTDSEKRQIYKLGLCASSRMYDLQLNVISHNNPDIAEYLNTRRQSYSAQSFLASSVQPQSLGNKRQRFGCVVGNACEQLFDFVDKPITTMARSLLQNVFGVMLERRARAEHFQSEGWKVSKYARDFYAALLAEASGCQVQVLWRDGSVYRAVVSQIVGETQATFVMTMNTEQYHLDCSCKAMDEMGMPCLHGVALMQSQGIDAINLTSWFHPRYHVSTLLQMYDYVPPDLSLCGKLKVEELVPPEDAARVVSRKRKAKSSGTHPHKCSACGQLGHHAKTCPQPSTAYRYKLFVEKAKEWAEDANSVP